MKMTIDNLEAWRAYWVNAASLSLAEIIALADSTLRAMPTTGWTLNIALRGSKYHVRVYDHLIFAYVPDDRACVESLRLEDGITDAFLRILYYFAQTGILQDGSWR